MVFSNEMDIWMVAAETRTTTADQGKALAGLSVTAPGRTFCAKHLSTVRAEEMLWVPGLVHCRQHFLEKKHRETRECGKA